MSTRRNILELLSDGFFHSGTELGATLGITRAAVNKAITYLNTEGLDIHSVGGKGYRWSEPSRLLDVERLTALLAREIEEDGLNLEVVDETESTTGHLISGLSQKSISGSLCVAESQSGGRGRRGRSWHSSPYRNVIMSMAWQFETGPAGVSGLSIAAGVAVARALEKFGVSNVRLKWPNDVLVSNRKLAGLLVDLRGESAGPTTVVLGLGLNVHINERTAEDIDQPWVDLRQLLGHKPDRNELVAILICELTRLFKDFAEQGLAPFIEDWHRHHAFADQPVRLIGANDEIRGIVCGLDATGALMLRTDSGEVISAHSGELSLRAN